MSQFFAGASQFPIASSGSFTPTLLLGGGNTGMTGTFTGRYVKTGLQVDIMISIALTALGSSTGQASIGGLPFTTSSTAGTIKWLPLYMQNWTATGVTYTSTAAEAGVGTTTLAALLQVPQNAATTLAIDDTNLSNTSILVVSGTYWAAS